MILGQKTQATNNTPQHTPECGLSLRSRLLKQNHLVVGSKTFSEENPEHLLTGVT